MCKFIYVKQQFRLCNIFLAKQRIEKRNNIPFEKNEHFQKNSKLLTVVNIDS